MSGSNRFTLSRRTLLTAAGTSALMLPARPTHAGGLATTPGQTEGPFYPPELPRDMDADLVIVDPDPEPMPDQARRHGVEHLAQDEAAARRHEHGGLVEVGGPLDWQRAERAPLELERCRSDGHVCGVRSKIAVPAIQPGSNRTVSASFGSAAGGRPIAPDRSDGGSCTA